MVQKFTTKMSNDDDKKLADRATVMPNNECKPKKWAKSTQQRASIMTKNQSQEQQQCQQRMKTRNRQKFLL